MPASPPEPTDAEQEMHALASVLERARREGRGVQAHLATENQLVARVRAASVEIVNGADRNGWGSYCPPFHEVGFSGGAPSFWMERGLVSICVAHCCGWTLSQIRIARVDVFREYGSGGVGYHSTMSCGNSLLPGPWWQEIPPVISELEECVARLRVKQRAAKDAADKARRAADDLAEKRWGSSR